MRNATRNLKFMESVHLKCLFYYFKACGLAPVNFNIQAITGAKVNRWTFLRSYRGIVYNIFLIFCITVCSYANIKDNYYTTNHWGFDGTVYAIVDTYAICNTVGIILIFCINHAKLLVLFGRVNNTRETIKGNNDSESESNKLLCKIMVLIFINVVSWTFLITTIIMYTCTIALSFSAPSICIFIRNALTLQYCISLKLIEDLFDTLNNNLHDLSKYYSLPLQVTSINATEINEKLSQLWEWYSLLRKLTRDTSNFYSLPMLLNILCEFLMTITITYFISKPLIFGESSLDTLDYVNSLAFLFIHIYPIILLTTSVSNAVNKSQETIEMVNEYLKGIEVQIIKEKLLHFSIYLLHNDIEFTVFDLFSLDGSLLVSVTGSVTTYLVILLQFQPPTVKTTTENTFNITTISSSNNNNVIP